MERQLWRPYGLHVVVDEPDEDERETTYSAWFNRLATRNYKGAGAHHLERYPHPSAPGWHRGTRGSGWKEVPEGVAGRYSDDGHAHLARLRNFWTDRALELWPEATHSWMVDSDVVPDPDVLGLLLEADKDIVAAVVRNSAHSFNFMLGRAEDGAPHRTGLEAGTLERVARPFKVALLGACTLVRREVLEGCVRFGPGPRGEDFAFCAAAEAAGYGLWLEPRARCEHHMHEGEGPLR